MAEFERDFIRERAPPALQQPELESGSAVGPMQKVLNTPHTVQVAKALYAHEQDSVAEQLEDLQRLAKSSTID